MFFKKSVVQVYDLGVERGLFRSKFQRSLYNVDRLTARPWWSLQQTTYGRELRFVKFYKANEVKFLLFGSMLFNINLTRKPIAFSQKI